MFGVVPKPLWQKQVPADEHNRIQLNTNCLLVETPQLKILVDTGYGSKLSEKELRHIVGEAGNPIVENLGRAGVAAEQIDIVIFSHLHFDHSCGATKRTDSGEIVPVFSRARHIVQRLEWEDATSARPELAGSYETAELLALEKHGLLELVEDDHEVCSGVSVQRTAGHTRGHQIIKIDSGGQQAAYLGDICPTSAHLKTFWIMAYDLFPGDVRRMKPLILQSMADSQTLLLFDHDPNIQAARLQRDDKGQVTVSETIPLI